MVEWENYAPMVWMVVALLPAFLLPSLDPASQVLRAAGFITSMVLLFFLSYFVELVVLKAVGQYTHLHAVVRRLGESRSYNLYLKRIRSFPTGNGMFMTYVDLAKPVKWFNWGIVRTIAIVHEGEWTKRFRYWTNKARYAATVFMHPRSDFAVLYDSNKPVTMDESNRPVPLTTLVEAGNDYYTGFRGRVMISSSQIPEKSAALMTELEAEVQRLRLENARLQEEKRHIAADLRGMKAARSADFTRAVKDHVVMIYNMCATIDRAYKMVGAQRARFTMVLSLILLLALGTFVMYIYMNPDIAERWAAMLLPWLRPETIIPILAIILVVVLLIVLMTRRRRV
ncbi:MAG: hypothetical protein QXI99_07950 [Candidatus Caldarchaeum sp.]